MADSHTFDTPRDYYRKLCFEILDTVSNEIVRRFCQGDLNMVLDIEKTLLAAGNGKDVIIPNTLLTKYKDDLC